MSENPPFHSLECIKEDAEVLIFPLAAKLFVRTKYSVVFSFFQGVRTYTLPETTSIMRSSKKAGPSGPAVCSRQPSKGETKMKRPPKMAFLSASFVMATMSVLCLNVSTQMLNTTLSPFAAFLWGSKTMGGLLTSFFNVGSILMALLSAPLIEAVGKKRSIVSFSLLYGASTLLFVLMPKEHITLLARLLQGVAKGVITVACSSVIADVTPDEQMNEGMGLFGLGSAFAMAFGPMIALHMVGANNRYDRMFLICAAVVACGALFGAFVKYTPVKRTARRTAEKPPREGLSRLLEKRALLPSINYTVFFAAFACILVFSSVYAQEMLGLSPSQISMFYVAAAAAMLVVRLFGGKLADRCGELVMIVPGHLCIAAALAIFIPLKSGPAAYPLFLLCGVLYGIGNASVLPTMNAIAVVDSPKERSSEANATFYFTMDFGILFSSSVFGKVMDLAPSAAAGYRITYGCSIGICAVSLLISVALLNRRAREKRRGRE